MTPILRTESDGDIMSDPNANVVNTVWAWWRELTSSSSVFSVLSFSLLIDIQLTISLRQLSISSTVWWISISLLHKMRHKVDSHQHISEVTYNGAYRYRWVVTYTSDKKCHKNRTLWNITFEVMTHSGSNSVDGYVLRMIFQIRSKPVQRLARNAELRRYTMKEKFVIYCVKGGGKIKQQKPENNTSSVIYRTYVAHHYVYEQGRFRNRDVFY